MYTIAVPSYTRWKIPPSIQGDPCKALLGLGLGLISIYWVPINHSLANASHLVVVPTHIIIIIIIIITDIIMCEVYDDINSLHEVGIMMISTLNLESYTSTDVM